KATLADKYPLALMFGFEFRLHRFKCFDLVLNGTHPAPNSREVPIDLSSWSTEVRTSDREIIHQFVVLKSEKINASDDSSGSPLWRPRVVRPFPGLLWLRQPSNRCEGSFES